MIKLLTHNGFIEPSNGVKREGFAIRGRAKLKFRLGKNQIPEKLLVTLYRTNKHWPNAFIKIQLSNLISYKLHTEDIGLKDISIDLPRKVEPSDIEITFSIYPKGLVKVLKSSLFKKTKTLVRDSILINRLHLNDTKIINYYDNSRFAYGDSIQKNKVQVRILGFFGQTFGLAEAARRTYASLEKTGHLVKATQIPYSGKHHGSDNTVKADKKIPTNTDEIRIFHFNGDHFDKLISDWGESILDCKYKIGFWHWELPEFPDDYLPWFNYLDEVWVPSRFVYDAIAPKSPIPVQIIPLALDDKVLKPPLPDRIKFNIPIDKIVFLITFDFYSIMERKNPISGIKAFEKLLEDDNYKDKVHLVIKVSNHHADPKGFKLMQKELMTIESKRFTQINEVLARSDMLQLINSCDSLISLHRSEGFGLHLAEAIALEKAVIATNWSGNTEFMNIENSYPVKFEIVEIKDNLGQYRKGAHWAQPNLDSAVMHMCNIVRCLKQELRNTPISSESIESLFVDKVAVKIVKRLNNIKIIK
jgi:glycosyltransferase involved in cell wall biosynthesis